MNKLKTEIPTFPVKFSLKKIARQFSFSINDIKALKPLVQKLYGNRQVSDEEFKKALDFTISKMNGTPFFKSVWKEIANIEKGKTITYSDIANSLGISNGARAVANVCAKNPFPLLIPCHRVIGKRGLGGYTISMPHLYEAFNMEANTDNALKI